MSNKQLKILRNIRKYKHLGIILKKCGYTMDEYLEFQQNFPEGSLDYMIFSDRHFDENTTIMLTAKSESILDEDRRNSIRFYVPLILSAVSVLISAAAFVKSFFF